MCWDSILPEPHQGTAVDQVHQEAGFDMETGVQGVRYSWKGREREMGSGDAGHNAVSAMLSSDSTGITKVEWTLKVTTEVKKGPGLSQSLDVAFPRKCKQSMAESERNNSQHQQGHDPFIITFGVRRGKLGSLRKIEFRYVSHEKQCFLSFQTLMTNYIIFLK